MVGAVLGGIGQAVLGGGIGDIAGKAAGGVLNDKGIGGPLGQLLGGDKGIGGLLGQLLGGEKGGGGADQVLSEIKGLLSEITAKLNGNGAGGAGGAGGASGARGDGDAAMPGQGHAAECAVNIPGLCGPKQEPGCGEEPPSCGTKPPACGEEPPSCSAKPPACGEEPPACGAKPPACGEEPPACGEEPPAPGNGGGNGRDPKADGLHERAALNFFERADAKKDRKVAAKVELITKGLDSLERDGYDMKAFREQFEAISGDGLQLDHFAKELISMINSDSLPLPQ